MASNYTMGAVLGWRKWSKRDWTTAAVGFSILLFAAFFVLLNDRTPSTLYQLTTTTDDDDLVDLTLLHTANSKGAFCLDGSLPGYHFHKGFGSGSDKWLLHIEGGGWCSTVESCLRRKTTALGSSEYMGKQVAFRGILSRDPTLNPDFFSWNRVKVRYCDGASFSGHPDVELKNGPELYFRGQLIWEALMEELLSMGLSDAKQAFLTGCSAGGLATFIHCDDFRERLPKEATVKCLADAGFFLDEKDVLGNYTMRSFYHDVVHLHGVARSLPKDCVAEMEPFKCLFPQELIKHRKTPFFIVNPSYDWWQIQNILAPPESDPQGYWAKCRLSLQYCDASQMEKLLDYRSTMLKALSEFQKTREGSLFVDSCFSHCQTLWDTWHSPISPRIVNKTIAEAVGDWYFNGGTPKLIDCPSFSCNPTCYNSDFTRS